jgi:hypothetical protein
MGVEVLLRDDTPPSPRTRLRGIGTEAFDLAQLEALQSQGRRVAALHVAPSAPEHVAAAAEAWVSCGADAAFRACAAAEADALLPRGGLVRLPGLLRRARTWRRTVLAARGLGPAWGLAGMLPAALWPHTPQPALAALAGSACVALLLGLALLADRGGGH